MNNKIYIIATAENKHLIIPYLESLGGVNDLDIVTADILLNRVHYIDEEGYIDGWHDAPEGYTEIHLKEQDGVICAYGAGGGVPPVVGGGGAGGEGFIAPIKYPKGGDIINPSELEQLKKENEQLRECLAKGVYAVEIWCATIEEQVDEYDTQFIEQAKQLLR